MQNRILIIFIVFSLLFQSCENRIDYIAEFKKNQILFDSLAQAILLEYPNDTSIKGIVIVNMKIIKRRQVFERVDTAIQPILELLNIEEVYVSREGSCNFDCFDKVYLRPHKNSYYPIVQYIYSRCEEGSLRDYKSKTIIRKSINSKWELLIDSN